MAVTADGKTTLTFTMQGGQSHTITGITPGTTYTVSETSIPDGWKQVGDAVITGGDQNRTIAARETEKVTITNEKVIPVTATKSWVDLETNTSPHPTIYFKL